MKLLVLYRPYSEHARRVEEFVHEFSRRNSETRIELMNIDGREGSAMATLYDIVRYPAMVAMRDDSSVQMSWQGDTLPLIDEVAAYAGL